MLAPALVLTGVAFAALGGRVTMTIEQMQNGSYAQHQKSQNAGNAMTGSVSLAELRQSQLIAEAGAPFYWKWLPFFLLGVSRPSDSFALIGATAPLPYAAAPLHGATGHGQIAPHPLRSGSGDGFAQESEQARKPNLTKLVLLDALKKDGLQGRQGRFSTNGDPTLKGMRGHLRQTRSPAMRMRRSPAMSAGVLERPTSAEVVERLKLELQRAPPAPPPPPKSRGRDGPGGGDDDGKIVMARLSESQAVNILDDWIARTKVYCTSGQFGNEADVAIAEVHRKSLEELEAMRSFSFNGTEQDSSVDILFPSEKIVIALYAPDKTRVVALAGGGAHWQIQTRREAFVIKHVSVDPLEVNDESSTAAVRLKEGLRLMADDFGSDLILQDRSDEE